MKEICIDKPESKNGNSRTKRLRIKYSGIVQGVGFRPHIFRLAKAHNLSGFVKNDPAGVTVEVEGCESEIKAFLEESLNCAPVLARIKDHKIKYLELASEKDFKIMESGRDNVVSTQVSPDAATCEDCLKDILDPSNRRYRYAFTNCTNCGPRYTIVKRIPYDRPNTTMKGFRMCPDCLREYQDPLNRRFHAQPNACPRCGPELVLLDRKGSLKKGDPIKKASELLRRGAIIAVKSLGGYQLACDALNERAVAELRSRKFREDKPFALMAADIETIEKYCEVGEAEKSLLLSPEKPIVLLAKREASGEGGPAKSVAPGQKTWGFMLPYTPLHHLLMRDSGMLLVMTSGNMSDEPIAYRDEDARARLEGIADYWLTHNRPIHIRCDDSVARVFRDAPVFIRRARGYAPRFLAAKLPGKASVLACGGYLKNTFCLTKGGQVVLSHHIGDLDNLETLRAYEEGIEHLKSVFEIEPEACAYDMHPEYISTRYAMGLSLPKIPVQHHHAHAAAVMAEHGLTGPVIGVSMDGTGYGTDGAVWGCEFLVADLSDFDRRAHLCYIPMPGGEKAISEPWRMMAAFLDRIYKEDFTGLDIPAIRKINKAKWAVLKKAMDEGLNSPDTSSMGRLFDAVSALLDIRSAVNYEGQAAIELEMAADDKTERSYSFSLAQEGGKIIIDALPVIEAVVSDIKKGRAAPAIAGAFHNGVAKMTAEVCAMIRDSEGIDSVTLAGGVFQNMLLLGKTCCLLDEKGFRVYLPREVPPNDGGLCLGQAAIALKKIETGGGI